MKKKILLFSVLVFSVAAVFSQRKMNLKQCIDYALENNLSIQQIDLDKNISINNLEQEKLSRLPNLNASSSYNFSFGRTNDLRTNKFVNTNQQRGSFGFSSSVDLFKGFTKKNTLIDYRFQLDAMLKDIDKLKDDLSLRITSLYLNVLFKKELIHVSSEQLELSKKQIERSKKLIQAGSLAKGALYQQQAQFAKEELSLVRAQNDLTLALLDLAQLMNIKDIDSFDVKIPLLPTIVANKSLLSHKSIFQKALNIRPEIEAAKLRLESYNTRLKIAKGTAMPTLSLSAGWGVSYSDSFYDATGAKMSLSDQLDLTQNENIRIGLSIPIFNGGQVKKNVRNARIRIDKAKLNIKEKENILRKDVQLAYVNAKTALNSFLSSQAAVTSINESFRYTEEKFNLGLLNSFDFNTAKNNVLKIKSENLQAKYDYIFRTKILDFYNGREIVL